VVTAANQHQLLAANSTSRVEELGATTGRSIRGVHSRDTSRRARQARRWQCGVDPLAQRRRAVPNRRGRRRPQRASARSVVVSSISSASGIVSSGRSRARHREQRERRQLAPLEHGQVRMRSAGTWTRARHGPIVAPIQLRSRTCGRARSGAAVAQRGSSVSLAARTRRSAR